MNKSQPKAKVIARAPFCVSADYQNETPDNLEFLPSEDGAVHLPLFGYISTYGDANPRKLIHKLDEILTRNPSTKIIIDVDSGGGEVTGVAEAFEYIFQAVQNGAEIHAEVRGVCCSSAYWIASACKTLTASRGAIVGNCGAYIELEEYVGESFKTLIISSGELKTAGASITGMSEEQRDFLQNFVADLAEQFFTDVKRARPQVNEEIMRTGAYWLADKAYAYGFTDGTIKDLNQ